MRGPVNDFAISATTTRAPLLAATGDELTRRSEAGGVMVTNNSGATAIYVGGAAVTAASGTPIPAGGSLSFNVDDPSRLYIITASGTADVRVIYQ